MATVVEELEPLLDDETEAEREARLAEDDDLQFSKEVVQEIVDGVVSVANYMFGHPLRPYQLPCARRIVESLIIGDGATITALFSRQSGKSELVADIVSACMIVLPTLAKTYPDLLAKFTDGVWVGCFGPTDFQADIIYSRIVSRLTSERTQELVAEIGDEVIKGRGSTMYLRDNHSSVRRQTAHPRSAIEGETYHLILIDEAQDADERVVNKSISPMGAATNATMVMVGTPSYTKGVFYKTIQINKRAGTKRGARQNHYEADWREAAKYNDNYRKYIRREILRIGEDSDEFQLAYALHWLTDKGMFVSSERLEQLGDPTMRRQQAWNASPVLVGIDLARKQDSTVVTVVWVDWDHPDEFGYYRHRILNWLDLTGVGWEEQYARIVDFLANYSVYAIGVDEGGLGDVVIPRLRVLMPHIPIVPVPSTRPEQSKRWKHLKTLIDRGMIGWPAHSTTRRLKIWKRFIMQMEDLETQFEGPYMLAAAPRASDAHDDFPDSVSIACIIAEDFQVPEVEVSQNPFYRR